MKRNRIVALIAILSMITLTGCMDMSDLTEEQSDLVAEYSAGVLLRYSDRYERRLITKEQLEKQGEEIEEVSSTSTEEATPTSATDVSTDGTTTDGNSEPEVTEIPGVSVNDFYHLDGVTVAYDSYQFVDKYGTDSQIRADKGETLLVVSFSLKNTSGKTKNVSLLDRTDISYTLDVDGSQYEPGLNILENGGMNFLSTKLKSGKKEKAVLIYRMDQAQKNAASITLTIADGNQQSKVTLR